MGDVAGRGTSSEPAASKAWQWTNINHIGDTQARGAAGGPQTKMELPHLHRPLPPQSAIPWRSGLDERETFRMNTTKRRGLAIATAIMATGLVVANVAAASRTETTVTRGIVLDIAAAASQTCGFPAAP
jgi:hypothetical protein